MVRDKTPIAQKSGDKAKKTTKMTNQKFIGLRDALKLKKAPEAVAAMGKSKYHQAGC